MTLRFTILGCGSSMGVPRPALGWGACDPNNPKNRRRRTSLLVERRGPKGHTRVLVDTSPDLRDQLLDANVEWLDGVLMTHEHADHCHGIDDLRALFVKKRRRLDSGDTRSIPLAMSGFAAGVRGASVTSRPSPRTIRSTWESRRNRRNRASTRLMAASGRG